MRKNLKNREKSENLGGGLFLLFFLLSLPLSLPLTLALGIQPAKTSFIFEQTPEFRGQFQIINNEQKEFTVRVYPEGDLAEYIHVSPNEITFKEGDSAKSVVLKINLPLTTPPGVSTSYVVVEQDLGSTGPNVISSRVLLKHKVLVQGEYPDKYVEVKVNFQDQGNEIQFVSEVENLGKKDIERVKTTFFVNGEELDGEELDAEEGLSQDAELAGKEEQIMPVAETETVSLDRKETKLLKTKVDKSLFSLGEYKVSAITEYDDLEVELVKELRIGKPEVDVTYFNPYFVSYQVNEYAMDLLNKWNKKIKNVFVDVEIKKNEQKIDEFRTKSVDIESLAMERIQDYLDARDKEPGSYTFNLVVNFWNNLRMEQKTFPFETEFLSQEELVRRGSAAGSAASSSGKGAAGQATGGGESGKGLNFGGKNVPSNFFLGAFFIIAGGGLFYLFWRYTHRDRRDCEGEKF